MKPTYRKVLLCLLLALIIQPQVGASAADLPSHLVLVSNESSAATGSETAGTLQDRHLFDVMPLSAKNKSKILATKKHPVLRSLAVGNIKKFWVYNLNDGTSKQISATLRYKGSRAMVWVKGSGFSTNQAAQLGQSFDSTIYPLDVNLFGNPSDVDGNGRINILCYAINDGQGTDGGFASGYFDPDDLTGASQANHAEVLYVDTSQVTDGNPLSGMETTLAHEFQHLINFNQRVLVDKHNEMVTWLNEGLAMAAEQAYSGHVLQDRIDYYNLDSEIARGLSLTQWSDSSDSLGNYSLAYLFVQYLRIQSGQQAFVIYKDLIHDPSSGYRAVQDVIRRYISPTLTFGQFMTDFRLALYLNEPTGRYGFHDEPGFSQIHKQLFNGTLSGYSLNGGGAVIARLNGTSVPANKGADLVYINLSDANKDFDPPAIPSLAPFSDHQTVLSGTAEAGNTVIVTNGTRTLEQTQADNASHFSVTVPLQRGGSRLYVFAEDSAGNAGLSRIVTVLDRTPPARPRVQRIHRYQRYVSGTAERSSKITIYHGRTRLGSGTVSKHGKFRVRLKKLQSHGKKLKIYATDRSGNRSTARIVTVR